MTEGRNEMKKAILSLAIAGLSLSNDCFCMQEIDTNADQSLVSLSEIYRVEGPQRHGYLDESLYDFYKLPDVLNEHGQWVENPSNESLRSMVFRLKSENNVLENQEISDTALLGLSESKELQLANKSLYSVVSSIFAKILDTLSNIAFHLNPIVWLW